MSPFEIDPVSLLVDAHGGVPLGALEAGLSVSGFTLGLEGADMDATVARWLAEGARGAPSPWDDPVDHLVAGFVARSRSGKELVVRPAPRRSVGPDLAALVVGQRERFFTVIRATLRIAPIAHSRPRLPFVEPPQPPVSAEEEALLARIALELSKL